MPIKTTPEARELEMERQQFRSLLVSNPNYFGNLEGSDFQAVSNISGNTTYETLKCVGLYPEFDLLEAIVYINQTAGYGGDLCSNGTTEYVRFYLSYDDGATWEDQGVTGFKAQDIPGPKPLEYAVQLKISPKKYLCFKENLPKVRAILSWEIEPPANSPNWTPVWGNHLDGRVQIDVFQFILKFPQLALKNEALVALLKENNFVPKNASMAEVEAMDLGDIKKDIAKGLTELKGKALSVKELADLYREHHVEEKRYLFPTIKTMVDKKTSLKLDAAALAKSSAFANLNLNVADVVGSLVNTDGNTSYEELKCIGLNTNNDNLEATIKVKKPYGYLGGLCKPGSREYVAFWMNFGGGWTYVGTTSVKVHDISSIPAEGLDYAVTLPVDLSKYRKPCHTGPRTADVRAILSWETPPDPTNENYKPTWGNREETLVLITPGEVIKEGTHPAFIETVGGMSVDDINNINGLANGAAVTAGFSALDSPFGGEIIITGHLANPTDISAGAASLEYQVQTSDDGGASWQTIANSFTIHRSQLLGGIWSTLPVITQSAPGGWYTYREDLTSGPGNAQIFVQGNILARWQTTAAMDGLWKMRIRSRVAGTVAPVWTSASVTAMVDNVAPNVHLDITSGGGVCADFNSGTVISGPYQAFDTHFGSYTFSLVPASGGTFTVNPSGGGSFSGGPASFSRSYPIVPGSGEFGTWELNTAGIPQCGYVIYLHAYDRTIVDSGYVGRHGSDVVGLCIRE